MKLPSRHGARWQCDAYFGGRECCRPGTEYVEFDGVILSLCERCAERFLGLGGKPIDEDDVDEWQEDVT
jgi:hypothetical protein